MGGGGGNKAESRVTFSKKGREIGAVVLISTLNFSRTKDCSRHTNSGAPGKENFDWKEFISESSEVLKF